MQRLLRFLLPSDLRIPVQNTKLLDPRRRLPAEMSGESTHTREILNHHLDQLQPKPDGDRLEGDRHSDPVQPLPFSSFAMVSGMAQDEPSQQGIDEVLIYLQMPREARC